MYIKRSRILYDAESGIFLVCLGALVSVCVVQLWKRSWVPFSVPTMIFFADITEQPCFQDAGHGFETNRCHGVIHFNASCQIQDMATVVCDKYCPVFLSSASV